MKKVGILTFHRAENYGAVLQAYALMTTLEATGKADASVIDYANPAIDCRNTPEDMLKASKNPLKARMIYLACKKDIEERNRAFDEARQLLHMDRRNVTAQELPEYCRGFDLLISGSDQVWNLNLTGRDYNYLMDFDSGKAVKASYAAGVSMSRQEIEQDERYLRALQNVQHMSLREQSTADMLADITKRQDVVSCIDPVFLLSGEQWRKFARPAPANNYVLVFTAGRPKITDQLLDTAKRYAKAHGLEVYYFSNARRWYEHRDVKHVGMVTPMEFVSWIDNAECVFTNSFHATAFSMILHTKFFVETQMARADRVVSLTELGGLEACRMNAGVYQDFDSKSLNWNAVDAAIRDKTAQSRAYLNRLVE